jgi:anti-sigma factor RsiW
VKDDAMPDRPTDDTIPPADGEDELLHAYLDGEASAAERARVEGDPALLARLEAVRTLRAEVRAALEVPAEQAAPGRELRLAAALDAFAAPDAAGDGEREPELVAAAMTAPAPVSSLDEARERRSNRARLGAWLGAVAVVLVGLFAAGTALRDRDHSSNSSTAVDASSERADTKLAPADTGVGAESASPLPDRNAQIYGDDASGGAATATTTAGASATTAAGTTPPATTTASATGGQAANEQPSFAAVPLDTTDDLVRYVADQRRAGLRDLGQPCDGRFGEQIGNVQWRGTPAIVVVQPDTAAPTVARVVDGGCVVLAAIDVP